MPGKRKVPCMPDAKIQLSLRPVSCSAITRASSSVVICHQCWFVIVIVIITQGRWATSMVLRLWRLELARAGRRQLCSWEAVQHHAGDFSVLVVAVQQGAVWPIAELLLFATLKMKVMESSSSSPGRNNCRDLASSSCSSCLLYRLSLAKVYILSLSLAPQVIE